MHVCFQGGGIANAYDVSVAQKFNKSAKRNCTDFPARAVSIRNAEQLRTKADRECCNLNPAPSRNQEVAKFVKEHDRSQDKDERDEIAREPKTPCPQTADQTHSAHLPLPRPRKCTVSLLHD